MKTSDYYYDLPGELIAQTPLEKRDGSKLLALLPNGKTEHAFFSDIARYLLPGDLLVINTTKVLPARLLGVKEQTGGRIEFLLLKNECGRRWRVLVQPGKRAAPGSRFIFGKNSELKALVLDKTSDGGRIVEFEYDGIFEEVLDTVGIMPLPPYIKEKLDNGNRYQTVYAEKNGSAAAPTAGLHFTAELMQSIREYGVIIAPLVLHVGLGTFRPVKAENIEDHIMHEEYYEIGNECAEAFNAAKAEGRRVIAVGTTSVRVLESACIGGRLEPGSGSTDIFIYPGYQFKAVDGLITNFHLPESTLLMLISAFAGKDRVMGAYEVAIKEGYRFFSFGDAMIVFP